MGRLLGLDFGTKRVGAALSDARRAIATPLEVYERRDKDRDAEHFIKIIKEYDVERLVVGLPLHTGGGEGELAVLARRWGEWLAGETGRPVTFFDERYTSVDAEESLRGHGLKARRRKGLRDMLAARILLQNYIDAGCPVVAVLPEPLDDPTDEDQSDSAGSM
ncbi:MAG TPA: Holliday junction resolvase RuvX [Isosphaeraceae bacterium]|jgi:putative Holliday junction resolvase|nr:Holliday junction resolvase RuvX [Isosphaeraceae bacterium]